MTPDEFDAWCEANERLWFAKAWDPCADCCDDFAAEMRAENRCDGEPAIEAPRRPHPHIEHLKAQRRERIDRAMALLGDGMHAAAIARHMGVSKSCVTRWLVSAREGAA